MTADPLPDALRVDPAAAPSAGRAQAADARIAVGPSDGGAGALAADFRAGSRRLRGRGRAARTPSPRRNFSPACAVWWPAAPAGRSSIRCRPESFSHLGLVARAFEPAILYEIGVFHRRDREPSMLAAAFLDCSSDKLGARRRAGLRHATPGSGRRDSRPTPACGATSTTSAIAAAGSPAPRARSAPSRFCASGCARPRRRMPAARSPCPTAAGERRRRPCACPAAR